MQGKTGCRIRRSGLKVAPDLISRLGTLHLFPTSPPPHPPPCHHSSTRGVGARLPGRWPARHAWGARKGDSPAGGNPRVSPGPVGGPSQEAFRLRQPELPTALPWAPRTRLCFLTSPCREASLCCPARSQACIRRIHAYL